MTLTPKVVMWVFGVATIGGLALFLTLFQSSPGPLAAPHAKVIPGSFIWSCNQCHAEEGLESGCLACHDEIAGQLEADRGFHAYLRKRSEAGCEVCHPEHQGADFPLVSDVSWNGMDTNAFSHPHVEFNLSGKHDTLTCDKCHAEKLRQPFALAGFPDQVRGHTMLGLNQDCISCHRDVHESGDKTRDCTKCHNQDAFKPAPFFNHDQYYVLEGQHASASCAACHQPDVPAVQDGGRQLTFGPVKGKSCADCHASPHRYERELQQDCLRCHKAADATWRMGERGVDVAYHDHFGFVLKGAHAKVECARCHSPRLESYARRFPDPAAAGYNRHEEQCSSCHQDPHAGQFSERYASCSQCHVVEHFKPSTMGMADHPDTYPLIGSHRAVACNQCHLVDADSKVRRFKGTVSACRDCHANPHGSQFDAQIARNDCTACHTADFTTFKVDAYGHQNRRAFFTGKGHARASCRQCHTGPVDEQGIVQYVAAPTDCAACHADIHRGQFLQNETTHCERCHAAFDQWKADRFNHDRDSSFALDQAHDKVACAACHQAVPQPDGRSVVQYRPLTTRCEDCHGFQNK